MPAFGQTFNDAQIDDDHQIHPRIEAAMKAEPPVAQLTETASDEAYLRKYKS